MREHYSIPFYLAVLTRLWDNRFPGRKMVLGLCNYFTFFEVCQYRLVNTPLISIIENHYN